MRSRLAGSSRAVPAAAAAVAGLLLSACAARRCDAPKACCHTEWVPPHVETVFRYERVPAVCRTREMGVYAVRETPITTTREVPVTTRVPVADRCTVLVPVCEPTCLPVMGYRPVEDRQDRFCPTYGPGCIEKKCKEVTVCVGVNLNPCKGPPVFAGVSSRDVVRLKPGIVQTGVHVESVACGTHDEQVVVGRKPAMVLTGSRLGTVVTGQHMETVQVGTECRTDVVGSESHLVRTGSYQDAVVVRPSRVEAVPQQVTVPGYWVRVCDTGAHAGGPVLSPEDFRERCGR